MSLSNTQPLVILRGVHKDVRSDRRIGSQLFRRKARYRQKCMNPQSPRGECHDRTENDDVVARHENADQHEERIILTTPSYQRPLDARTLLMERLSHTHVLRVLDAPPHLGRVVWSRKYVFRARQRFTPCVEYLLVVSGLPNRWRCTEDEPPWVGRTDAPTLLSCYGTSGQGNPCLEWLHCCISKCHLSSCREGLLA